MCGLVYGRGRRVIHRSLETVQFSALYVQYIILMRNWNLLENISSFGGRTKGIRRGGGTVCRKLETSDSPGPSTAGGCKLVFSNIRELPQPPVYTVVRFGSR